MTQPLLRQETELLNAFLIANGLLKYGVLYQMAYCDECGKYRAVNKWYANQPLCKLCSHEICN